ncbi:nitrogen fixation protein FixF [Agrobacterium sp.]|jgi:capsular polysaccharide export protein|uniref:capsular polysaccharide export protein, LipB/KpsS family n=1 Tax=Agrobacterium sp. TaxID=361 RepID=UPI0028AD6930|nr:nitrogen fixation protein FixF [Agrobacterium sp.]
MADVEFIYSQRNNYDPLKAVLGLRLDCAPFKLKDGLKEFFRTHGIGELGRLFSDKGCSIDIRPSIEHNLLRRQIRLPALYSNPLSIAFYRATTAIRSRLSAILIEDRLNAYPDASALIFNGFMMPASLLMEAAIQRSRPMVMMENGFFPETIQCDTKGINFGSTLPRDAEFYRWVAPRIAGELPQTLVKRSSKQKGEELTNLPADYIFVPFQVPSDMQILAYSPWIKDMKHFYEVLYQLAETMPDRHFVIKEHPSFPLSIKKHIQPHPRIIFANHNETRKLIEGASAVITINSTVGLEAISIGKKVVVLGDAPYEMPELVTSARSIDQLQTALQGLNDWQPDETLRQVFLRYVYNIFLLPGSFKAVDAELVDRIRKRGNGADQHSQLLAEYQALQQDKGSVA